MALTNAGKAVMLAGLDTATYAMVITDDTDAIVDTLLVSNGDFTFSSSASGMVLGASVTFTIPAITVVVAIKLYDGSPTGGGNILATGTLSGVTADRTYTYAGTYVLTAFTVTLA